MKLWIESKIHGMLNWFGIDIFVRKPGYRYLPDYLEKYARERRGDIRILPLFGELASEVINSGRSPLYYDCLYTIYQLFLYLKSYIVREQCINSAEVGVYNGGSSYFIASLANRLGVKLNHYCFDSFVGYVARAADISVIPSQTNCSFDSLDYESVREYLYRFENLFVHKGCFRDSCSYVQNVQMHFVHLNIDIYETAIFALEFFDERLADGGVILLSSPSIEKAVREFTLANPQYFKMSLLTGQYILLKLK